jgi:hypothetical protein
MCKIARDPFPEPENSITLPVSEQISICIFLNSDLGLPGYYRDVIM